MTMENLEQNIHIVNLDFGGARYLKGYLIDY